MKWIKTRFNFLSEEAKIKDVILPVQSKEVKRIWGEKWLELEEIEPTQKIKQGKWKLSEEDKIKVFNKFFQVDLNEIYKKFEALPDNLNEIINKALDTKPLEKEYSKDQILRLFNDFDIKKPTINQVSFFFTNIFKKISVGESRQDEVIMRDETGRPINDEETGRPMKRKREEGEIIFSNNLVNIVSFLQDFNTLFPDKTVNFQDFSSGDISRLISSSREDFSGDEYIVEIDVYSKDLYLSINHNPKDILNMSISRFYSSCQHLYSGGWRERLLSNVFDPNSIPAFLVFDSPITQVDQIISESLPLSRMMIRNIETQERKEEPILFFDRAYPDRMKELFTEIVEKYSGNKETTESVRNYLFTPDIPTDLSLREPYMDNLQLVQGKYIGKNTTSLHLTMNFDWSTVLVSPSANIKEIVIQTVNLPSNLLEIPFKLNWVKFQYLKLNDLTSFSNIDTKSFAFDKCKISDKTIESLSEFDVKNLSFISCKINNLDLSELQELDTLELLFTIDSDNLESVLSSVKIKNKLVLSSDLVSDKKNKELVNELKKKGLKIEIIGPRI
jgi:hypothetical protein